MKTNKKQLKQNKKSVRFCEIFLVCKNFPILCPVKLDGSGSSFVLLSAKSLDPD
jgi:hypothetical protein